MLKMLRGLKKSSEILLISPEGLLSEVTLRETENDSTSYRGEECPGCALSLIIPTCIQKRDSVGTVPCAFGSASCGTYGQAQGTVPTDKNCAFERKLV